MHVFRRSPVARGALRHLAKRLAPEGPVERVVEGLRFRLAPRDNKVDFDIWYKGRLEERDERAFLAAGLRPGDVLVDIGANIGLYPVALLAAVPGLRAITFEPLDRLRARQAANLALNGLADRADVRAEAVGPAGTMRLHESRNAGRSSLLPFDGARPGRPVAIRPLADLLAGTRPAALKIDVEGFEAEALLPYFDTVPSTLWPRRLVIETLHRALWRRDCLQELVERGYVLRGETAENALLGRGDG
jgi:FkbM family methyltransferase